MITLDTDLYLLTSRFNISPKRLSEYGSKSIEEIMEAEAAQGNTQAANFSKEILSDPTELVKFFKLADAGNRYAILHNLSERDLDSLLPLLTPKDLAMGLNFFTKDKLLDLINKMPKKELVKYVFQLFSPEQVLQLMPEKDLNKFLQSPDLDKGLVLKHLKSLPPEILAQMIEAVTGKPVKKMDQRDLLNQIATLPSDKYRDALTNIPPQKKREFILAMTKEEPKLFELFEADSYTKLISRKEKPDIVKAGQAINPEILIKMLQELPQDLLAIVVTQIDPQEFAAVLIKNYQDILSQIVAG